MLKVVYSDFPGFKRAEFHAGLNLVLAERAKDSSNKKTRNGEGKSSLVELINFLLGGDASKGSPIRKKPLVDYFFGLELNVSGRDITIERTGRAQRRIYVRKGVEHFDVDVDEQGRNYISVDEWKRFLGASYFALPRGEVAKDAYPSFRALFSYFARTDGGFSTPSKYFAQQSSGSVQVTLSYLLGLDWSIAKEFDQVRHKEKLIKALNDAANEGVLGQIFGAASDIRTEILLKSAAADRLRSSLKSFRILPQYEEKERRAAEISRLLSDISGKDASDKEWVAQLELAVEHDFVEGEVSVEELFERASIEVPEVVKRRLEEVREFHGSLVRNRREHLGKEIDEIRGRIASRKLQKDALDIERSEILALLKSHGALDQYMSLQGELSRLDSDVENLRRKLEAVDNLEAKKTELKIERQNLLRNTRIDHSERQARIKEAVLSFAEISSYLYDEPGRLIIDATDNGPSFDFDIHAKESVGVNRMQIFCFDMTLMRMWAGRKNRPDFLIHDSHLFDGVDERQKSAALAMGALLAVFNEFQYIVTMNSDDLPKMDAYPWFYSGLFRADVRIDDTPTGGLFGVRI